MIPQRPPKLPHGQRHDQIDNPNKLFVGGVSRDTLQTEFREYFAQFGELEDCVVMIDQVTQKSRGFGFVVFKDHETVIDVLSRASQSSLVLRGRTLDCKKAIPRSKQQSRTSYTHNAASTHSNTSHYRSHRSPPDRNPYLEHQTHSHSQDRDSSYGDYHRKARNSKGNKIFVGGFSNEFTEQTLYTYFGKFGPVQEAVVMIDKDGNSRKFGFVTMVNSADADAVVFEGDCEIDGVHVTVQRAIPKAEIGDVPRRPTKKRSRHLMYGQEQPHNPYAPQPHTAPMTTHHPSMYGMPPQAPPPIYPPPSAYPQYAHLPPQSSYPHSYPHQMPHSSYPNVQQQSAYSNYAPPPPTSAQQQPVAAERYEYPYTVKRNENNSSQDPRNASVDIKEESKTTEQKKQSAVAASGQQAQPQPMYSAVAPQYAVAPVHAPAQYGAYHEIPPQQAHGSAYGATRGTVSATQTYKPY